jgi:hypothetical protein
MKLTAGLYFPEPYSPSLHLSVLRGVRGWIWESELTVWLTDLPASEVTKTKVDDTDIRGHQFDLRWDDGSLEAVIGRHYVNYIDFRLEGSWRQITLMTFLYDDTNVLLDIRFELTDEEVTGKGPLVPSDIGESRVLEALDRIDPFWAVLGVEAFAPSVVEILRGQPVDFGHAYLGTKLVELVGREAIAEALQTCPKVVHLPGGGVYQEWNLPRWWEQPGYSLLESRIKTSLREFRA